MALDIQKLSAWYGQAQALWNVDIRVGDGEIVGVLGRNGAGKTTLLRSIAGLQHRTAGQVSMDGVSIHDLRPHQISRHGVALVRESGQMAASLTVIQHLELGQRLATLRREQPRQLADVWRWFPLLEPLRRRPAGLLSGGQRQALALASAFIAAPRIMLLDEPSAGLAPSVASEMFNTIGQLAGHGLSVLVVEQHPGWLEGLARRNYLLEVGSVVAEGSVAELTSRKNIEAV